MPLPLLPWVIGTGSVLLVGTALLLRARGKPAREMTVEEAMGVMRDYAARGLVDIQAEGPRMVVGGRIAGVQHSYMDGRVARPRDRIDNLDPRFGVYLVRLDQLLRREGVDELLDRGITHGGENPLDVHNQGRAIDVGGLRGPRVDLDVLRDWAGKPESPVGTYRLGPTDDGYYLFRRIYDLAARQGADVNTRPEGASPSDIGYPSYIVTPDHPDRSLRASHRDHMHLQVGRTVGEDP